MGAVCLLAILICDRLVFDTTRTCTRPSARFGQAVCLVSELRFDIRGRIEAELSTDVPLTTYLVELCSDTSEGETDECEHLMAMASLPSTPQTSQPLLLSSWQHSPPSMPETDVAPGGEVVKIICNDSQTPRESCTSQSQLGSIPPLLSAQQRHGCDPTQALKRSASFSGISEIAPIIDNHQGLEQSTNTLASDNIAEEYEQSTGEPIQSRALNLCEFKQTGVKSLLA